MTVEAAFAVGTLVAVLAVVLAAMGAVVLQLRCVDAASEAARLGARGDLEGARDAARQARPPDVLSREGEPLGSAVEVDFGNIDGAAEHGAQGGGAGDRLAEG